MTMEEAAIANLRWMNTSETDILNEFAQLSQNYVRSGRGDFKSLFIPGNRFGFFYSI